MQKRQLKVLLVSFLLGSLFVPVGLFAWQGQGFMVGQADKQEDYREEIGVWSATDLVEQTFVASHNDLARIDIYLDSYYPWHSPWLEFRLFEIDTADNPSNLTYAQLASAQLPLRTVRLNGWLLSSHMFNSISFDPLPDSQGKRYLLSLRSPELKENGMFILMGSPEDRYDAGDLFVNGEQRQGDLAFRASYRRSFRTVAQQSTTLFILQKPFPFSVPLIYPALLLMYIAMLCGWCWLLIRQKG